MRSARNLLGTVLVLGIALIGLYLARKPDVPSDAPIRANTHVEAEAPPSVRASAAVGFRTRQFWLEHYAKHGAEFGSISEDEYLRRAQALRDGPAGGDVLEETRRDGVITRFDRRSGAFLAFDADGTIRTFFRPNQGELYFRRQLSRSH